MTLTFCCAVLALEIGVVFGILGGNALACLYESAARHPGGLDCARAADLLRRGSRVRDLPGLQGGQPRPD